MPRAAAARTTSHTGISLLGAHLVLGGGGFSSVGWFGGEGRRACDVSVTISPATSAGPSGRNVRAMPAASPMPGKARAATATSRSTLESLLQCRTIQTRNSRYATQERKETLANTPTATRPSYTDTPAVPNHPRVGQAASGAHTSLLPGREKLLPHYLAPV